MLALLALLALDSWGYSGPSLAPAPSAVGWSYAESIPQHADPRVADLESQLADLKRQLAGRDAGPKPPDIGPAYECVFSDGRRAKGWIIKRATGESFVEAPK